MVNGAHFEPRGKGKAYESLDELINSYVSELNWAVCVRIPVLQIN